jgi:L-ascorbate metabolism protein UlaG (beta-lactamase superfamily)
VSATVVTWLGQAGLLVEAGGTRVLIDPFVSEYPARRYSTPQPEAYAVGADALLVTHEHLDHLDEEFLPLLAESSPGVRIVVPRPVVEDVGRIVGVERVVGVAPGEDIRLTDDVSLKVVPAWHGLERADGYSTGEGRFLGYVVETPSLTLYHSGDTLATEELVDHVRDAGVDVAFLPINGRDAFREARGLVGNMSFREAVELATQIGASTLVPIHWDLFSGNTESPGHCVDEAVERDAELHVVVLRRFVPFAFARPGG